MVLNEENVMTIKDEEVIMVLNPETDAYVECYATIGTLSSLYDEETIFITACYSDCHGEGNYRERIHHLRGYGSHAAVMTRSDMAKLLINKQYTIS